jgi:hypothetical protein
MDKMALGQVAGFLRVLRLPLPLLIPSTAPHSWSCIIWGWYNRPNSGLRTKWTQFHPIPRGWICNCCCARGMARRFLMERLWTRHNLGPRSPAMRTTINFALDEIVSRNVGITDSNRIYDPNGMSSRLICYLGDIGMWEESVGTPSVLVFRITIKLTWGWIGTASSSVLMLMVSNFVH